MSDPTDQHPGCPHCGKRAKVRTLLDIDRNEIMKMIQSGDPQPDWFFGKPTDKRVFYKECLRGGWIHIKVNNYHRVGYMRGKKK